jgi:hypothetical protein
MGTTLRGKLLRRACEIGCFVILQLIAIIYAGSRFFTGCLPLGAPWGADRPPPSLYFGGMGMICLAPKADLHSMSQT